MPVKRKSSRNVSKLSRNNNINQMRPKRSKRSKRASQKKRGKKTRRTKRGQRGGLCVGVFGDCCKCDPNHESSKYSTSDGTWHKDGIHCNTKRGNGTSGTCMSQNPRTKQKAR